MTKLTDAQYIILTSAYANEDIVAASITKKITNKASITRSINALLKKGMLTTSGGLKGKATDADYSFDLDAEDTGLRLFITPAGQNALEGVDTPKDVVAAIAPKDEAPEADEDDVEAQDYSDTETLEGEDEDEEGRPCSVVKEGYKQRYRELQAEGGSGQGCNDAIDKWMQATFNNVVGKGKRYCLNVDQMFAFAAENSIDYSKWVLVNNGMKRMNVAKAVRHRLNCGNDIVHQGKRIFKGVKQKKAA